MYSRRNARIPDLLQAHEFEPAPEKKEKKDNTISDPTSENLLAPLDSLDHDLPKIHQASTLPIITFCVIQEPVTFS